MVVVPGRDDELEQLRGSMDQVVAGRSGSLVPLIATLGAQAQLQQGLNLPTSIAAATEAMALAEEIGQPHLARQRPSRCPSPEHSSR